MIRFLSFLGTSMASITPVASIAPVASVTMVAFMAPLDSMAFTSNIFGFCKKRTSFFNSFSIFSEKLFFRVGCIRSSVAKKPSNYLLGFKYFFIL
jgi:hypothetical protein